MPRHGHLANVGRGLSLALLLAFGTTAVDAQTGPASSGAQGRTAANDTGATKQTANTRGETGDAGSTATPLPANVAATDPAAGTAAGSEAVAQSPPAGPIVTAVRETLAAKLDKKTVHKDDAEALTEFYGEHGGPPLWLDTNGLTKAGKALVAEIRKGPDWGFEADDFLLPDMPAAGASTDALAYVELQLSIAALRYARFARGGRLTPRAISRILDVNPPVKDPKQVLGMLSRIETPDTLLRDLHPKHEQFERLRQAYLKARAPTEPPKPIDPALKVKLPTKGPTVRPGKEHQDVVLLRKRLKVPAEAGVNETLLDPKLKDALKAFQKKHGLTASGSLSKATRRALNREGEKKKPKRKQNVARLKINMEKWRWMPEDLGHLYVWSNVPEFYARVVKGNDVVFKEKIIAGLPNWATPMFSAKMEYIIFNPSWGVPNGIKTRELLPRLKKAGGGGFFGLFGGGGGSSVIRAYGLKVYKNGRPVDPDSVNWSAVDIRSYSFTQPPGGKNPLGYVKFRFPNKHSVYMHDTIERNLFSKAHRALSHGCMRVQRPGKLAEVLMYEDQGWSQQRVKRARSRGESITLQKPVPVHTTYMTAVVDENGTVSTFGDLYGHDRRISRALGQPMSFDAPRPQSVATGDGPPVKKKKKSKRKRKREVTSSDLISNSLGGLPY